MSDIEGIQDSEFQVERVSELGNRMSLMRFYIDTTPCGGQVVYWWNSPSTPNGQE